MTDMQVPQAIAAVIATATPWCVTRIATHIAARHAGSVRSPMPTLPSVARLGWATVAILPIVIAAAAALQPPSLIMGVLDAASFSGLSILGLRALGEIHEVSRPAREVDTTVRIATLQPRRVSQYLSWPLRMLPMAVTAVGLSVFAWRLASPLPDRRLFVPLGFACAAALFLLVYEAWIRSEVTTGRSADLSDDQSRGRRRIGVIFAVELTVILGCLGVALTLVNLDWSANAVWGAAVAFGGAVLGIVGCALAVSSELNRRSYYPVAPDSH